MSDTHSKPVFIAATRVARLMDLIFTKLGLEEGEKNTVIERLMEASLSGYHSHGMMRIPMYVAGIQSGNMVPGAQIEIIDETVSTLLLDANRGLGPRTATKAMAHAQRKAEATGIGCVSVFNANDVGRLGGYVEQPARDGYIALLMTNDAGGNPCVAPWGATSPLMSTNPIAVGIPRSNDEPILMDISTGVSSVGRVKMLRNGNKQVPDGWLIDGNGRSTNNPDLFLSTPRRTALFLLGSQVAGHKGFALSILVDVLTGALSGAGCSGSAPDAIDQNALFVLVIDPDKFVSKFTFAAEVDQFVERIKSARMAPGVEEIRVPGEGAYRERQRQLKQGLEIDPPVWSEIQDIMIELEIDFDRT